MHLHPNASHFHMRLYCLLSGYYTWTRTCLSLSYLHTSLGLCSLSVGVSVCTEGWKVPLCWWNVCFRDKEAPMRHRSALIKHLQLLRHTHAYKRIGTHLAAWTPPADEQTNYLSSECAWCHSSLSYIHWYLARVSDSWSLYWQMT